MNNIVSDLLSVFEVFEPHNKYRDEPSMRWFEQHTIFLLTETALFCSFAQVIRTRHMGVFYHVILTLVKVCIYLEGHY
jgi:hypothetical protein